jgi:hypothetical protein
MNGYPLVKETSRLTPISAGCRRGAVFALLLACLLPLRLHAKVQEPRAAELLKESMAFCDTLWESRSATVWQAPSRENPSPKRRSVRGTAWYALGLLARDGAGDRERAAQAIDLVLQQQIEAPGEPWDGTFFRAPEEPHPPLFARVWDDYDPNWRQFIGTTWALILLEFPDRLPAGMTARLEESIKRALQGEIDHPRLKPEYTNIALMHAFLASFAGQRFNRPDWSKVGDELADAVYALFKTHGTFEEYNSPTYYGVDFYGLALWRAHGPTPRFRQLGAEMEAALWREVAMYYHAGLRNICGPYDRGYGMDMTHYAALTGVWMSMVLPKEQSPLPAADERMEHAHDYGFAPLFAVLGAQVPADALEHFKAFKGERLVERQITSQRTATAWLGDRVMLGGEVTKLSRAAGTPYSQFYPATIHWKMPDGRIGWVLLKKASRIDARASANQLDIHAVGDAVFRIPVYTTRGEGTLSRDGWKLAGLNVSVETDATAFTAEKGTHWVDLKYTDATHFVIKTELSP